MDVDALQPVPSAADEGRILEELRLLKSQRSPRGPRIAKALRMLENAKSPRVRNAAALALADLRAGVAKEKLIDLLARPDTRGARGSLLYALDQLRADVPLTILAEIIANDTYEAREEALAIIERGRGAATPQDSANSRNLLEAAAAAADGERLQAVRRALKHLRITNHHGVRR